MTNRLLASLGLSVALVGLFAYAVVGSWQFPSLARYFPLLASGLGLTMVSLEAARCVLAWRRGGAAAQDEQRSPAELRRYRRRGLRMLVWIAGYVAAMAVVGYLVASAAFLVAFLAVEARLGLVRVGIASAACIGAIYALGTAMSIRWP